jgi:hypothetical protein
MSITVFLTQLRIWLQRLPQIVHHLPLPLLVLRLALNHCQEIFLGDHIPGVDDYCPQLCTAFSKPTFRRNLGQRESVSVKRPR